MFENDHLFMEPMLTGTRCWMKYVRLGERSSIL